MKKECLDGKQLGLCVDGEHVDIGTAPLCGARDSRRDEKKNKQTSSTHMHTYTREREGERERERERERENDRKKEKDKPAVCFSMAASSCRSQSSAMERTKNSLNSMLTQVALNR